MGIYRLAIVLLCACSYSAVEPSDAPGSSDPLAWLDVIDGLDEGVRRTGTLRTPAAPESRVPSIGTLLNAAQVALVLGDSDPEATPILPPRYGLARQARLSRVSAFQSVEVDLAVEGDAVDLREAPIVAGRSVRLRLDVADAEGDLLLARVRWTSDGETTLFVLAKPIAADSVDGESENAFEFDVPASLVTDDATLCAELLEDGGSSFDLLSLARYPTSGGSFDLAPIVGRSLRVHLVPMGYDFDGSARLPDVSLDAVEALAARFEAVYPVASIEIDVLAPRSYAAPLAADSFDDHVAALREVIQWRSDDGVATDTYYLGLIAPADTFGTYCATGCYTGIAPLNEANSAFQRAGLVVWYGDTTSGWTALHELGHTHGRAHAPCGAVAGADPSYPFADGSIGTWGFDQRSNTLVAPSAHDFMSYCGDEWVSAYTYSALSDRVQSVAAAAGARFEPADATPHHFVSIEGDVVHWRRVDIAPASSSEDTVTLHARGADSQWNVAARKVQFSIDAGFALVIPVDEAAEAYDLDGLRLTVPH